MGYREVVLADKPIALWILGGDGENLLNSGTDGSGLTASNITTRGWPTVVDQNEYAPTFSSGSYSGPTSSVYSPQTNGTLSLEAIVRPTSFVTGGNFILTKGNTSNFEWSLAATTAGAALMQVYTLAGANVLSVTGTTDMATGTTAIYHVVGVYVASGTGAIWVNGVREGTATASGSTGAGTAAVGVGVRADQPSGVSRWNGQIGWAAVYSQALSEDRIIAHYRASKGFGYGQGWWRTDRRRRGR